MMLFDKWAHLGFIRDAYVDPFSTTPERVLSIMDALPAQASRPAYPRAFTVAPRLSFAHRRLRYIRGT